MLRVDRQRLLGALAALAQIGQDPEGGVTRPAFSPADMQARHWLSRRMEELGMRVAVDAVGNVCGRLGEGNRALLLGSHTDTVPRGGYLDGALGVVSALECLRVLLEAGRRPSLPIEVVSFQDEEGRFKGLLGSRAFVGDLSAGEVASARDPAGSSLVEAMRGAGCDPGAATCVARPRGAYTAYVELHIEQGPRLETAGVPVGIVGAIVGIRRLQVTFEGRPDHAGTTPMNVRRDAFAAAMRFISRAGELFQSQGTPDTVWNVGVFQLAPGVANIVPARAEFILEYRDSALDVLDRLEKQLREAAAAVGADQQAPPQVTRTLEVPPTPMDPAVRDAISAGAAGLGLAALPLHSGGGHDAMMIARVAPAGMIFVPSVGGRSHCPDEATRPEDIEAGANVLLQTVLRLAG